MLSQKNCIKSCADLRITKELFDKKEWNEKDIQERTNKLIREFFEIWDIKKLNN
ncbi:hypothetical protein DMC01_03825 [Campylobacter troglodytis]|nr:hypothetical protein DMC01_03825 [Campylobacter troglodytis]